MLLEALALRRPHRSEPLRPEFQTRSIIVFGVLIDPGDRDAFGVGLPRAANDPDLRR